MTDAEDKTGRHGGGWAAKIPLVTLLVVVFGAGGVYVSQRWTQKGVDDLKTEVRDVGAKLDAHATTEREARAQLDARIRVQEISTAVRDAVAKEGRKR